MGTSSGGAGSDADRSVDRDRTTVSRIRDAALVEFAERGVAATTMKSVAESAGVSAQLVVHHFGSKEGLATACDEYVLRMFREHNTSLFGSGDGFAPAPTLEESWLTPAMAYLAARLVDDSPAVAQLVDEVVADSLTYLEKGVESGLVRPSSNPQVRAVVGMLWNLGALALHRHAKRIIGVDLLSGDREQLMTWTLAATEMLTEGLFNKEAYEALKTGADEPGGNDAANDNKERNPR